MRYFAASTVYAQAVDVVVDGWRTSNGGKVG